MLYKEPRTLAIMVEIFKTWRALLGVVTLVLFSTCMTSLVGMHLLGGSLGEAVCAGQGPDCDLLADYPRMNFETFEDGMFTSFRFMLGSGWSGVLSWYIESFRSHGLPGGIWTPGVFCCALYFWASLVLFNLFTAVLLINFGTDENDKLPTQRKLYWQNLDERRHKAAALDAAINDDTVTGADGMVVEGQSILELIKSDIDESHKTLCCFKPSSTFRQRCATVISSKAWDTLWVAAIMACCMTVATRSVEMMELIETAKDQPLDLNPLGRFELNWGRLYYIGYVSLETIVVTLFALEMMLKTVCSGFWTRTGVLEPYLQDSNNMADFVFLVLYALSYTDVLKQQTFLHEGSGSIWTTMVGWCTGMTRTDSATATSSCSATSAPWLASARATQ